MEVDGAGVPVAAGRDEEEEKEEEDMADGHQ
jgi:hypothetical protein